MTLDFTSLVFQLSILDGASTEAESLSFKPICHLPTAQWLDRQLTESRFAIGELVFTGCYEYDFCFNWAKSLFVSQM